MTRAGGLLVLTVVMGCSLIDNVSSSIEPNEFIAIRGPCGQRQAAHVIDCQ